MGTFIEPADSARLLTARGDACDGRLLASRIDASVGDISDFGAVVMASAGHDLREPLQITIAAHDTLARRIDGKAERAQLTLIEDAAMQIAASLTQLVEVLRLQDPAARRGESIPSGG